MNLLEVGPWPRSHPWPTRKLGPWPEACKAAVLVTVAGFVVCSSLIGLALLA